VELADDLTRIAATLGTLGVVSGVLPAEPSDGRRAYLVSFGEDEARRWLVVDDAGVVAETREAVREVASIVVLCELAVELAGGGALEDLRVQLAELRMTEQPDGIEEAEAAALALERTIGAPPRVASPQFLDVVGTATRQLEAALGGHESPFGNALAAAAGTVEAFVADVLSGYLTPLR